MIRTIDAPLVTDSAGFDYTALAPRTADTIRQTAKRIRDKVKRSLDAIIDVGLDLLKVKDALSHGQFGPWLDAEFGWTDRTARNLMAVAEHFGPKKEIISDLRICPTAAYLLAAPSVPFEARQAALDRASAGEAITAPIAQEIVRTTRKTLSRNGKAVSSDAIVQRLGRLLARLRERSEARQLSTLARCLREFADELEEATTKRNGAS